MAARTHGRLDDLHVFEQAEVVATVVRDGGAGRERDHLDKELVDVRQRQVREQDRVGLDRVTVLGRDDDAGNVAVEEDGTLWVAGRPTRVAEVDVHVGRRGTVRRLVLLSEGLELDNVEHLDPDRVAPLRHGRRGLDPRPAILGLDRGPAVEADDGLDLRHLARKLEKVGDVSRVGENHPTLGVVDNVLDRIRTVDVVQTVCAQHSVVACKQRGTDTMYLTMVSE